MTKNKYSRIISGAMTWAKWGKELSENEIITLINHCIDNDVTTFDHADIYGGYTTEVDFGKAISNTDLKRENYQLISKCGIQLVTDNRNNIVNHYNHSKDYIIWSAEESLKNLQTDYLDLLLIHRPSPLMQPEEVAEATQILKKQGKIKKFGVSNFIPSQMDLLSNYVDVSVNQIEFSLTQHTAMHDGTLDQTMLKKITPMAWSPLGSVFKEDNEQTRRIHKQLGELMDKYQATEDQLLLAWILKHPAGIHPVIGTTNKHQITNAAKASSIELELEDWFLILVASQGHEVP